MQGLKDLLLRVGGFGMEGQASCFMSRLNKSDSCSDSDRVRVHFAVPSLKAKSIRIEGWGSSYSCG